MLSVHIVRLNLFCLYLLSGQKWQIKKKVSSCFLLITLLQLLQYISMHNKQLMQSLVQNGHTHSCLSLRLTSLGGLSQPLSYKNRKSPDTFKYCCREYNMPHNSPFRLKPGLWVEMCDCLSYVTLVGWFIYMLWMAFAHWVGRGFYWRCGLWVWSSLRMSKNPYFQKKKMMMFWRYLN